MKSFFNEKQKKAMENGEYICSECGRVMEFEDEWEETLVEEYGCEGDEKYENLYPTREELLGESDD